MRKIIDLVKELFETPTLIGSGEREDFGLDQERVNRWSAKDMLANGHVVRSDDNFDLIKTGTPRNGSFGAIGKDGLLAYFVEFEHQDIPHLGDGVVQVLVWRDLSKAFTRGLTSEVFFQHLLPQFGAVVSDKAQTQDGRSFWIRIMAEADQERDHEVGFIDMVSGEVNVYDGDIALSSWIKDMDAWSRDAASKSKRFFVRRKSNEQHRP